MEQTRSVGIQRIVNLISAILLLIWLGLGIDGWKKIASDNGNIALFIGGIIVAWFTPQLILKICYWIKEGFEQDKNSKNV